MFLLGANRGVRKRFLPLPGPVWVLVVLCALLTVAFIVRLVIWEGSRVDVGFRSHLPPVHVPRSPSEADETMMNLRDRDVDRSLTRVLILTSMRSGSSFVGELFNNNPRAFYHFEPLRVLQIEFDGLYGFGFEFGSDPVMDRVGVAILDGLFDCDLLHPVYKKYLLNSALFAPFLHKSNVFVDGCFCSKRHSYAHPYEAVCLKYDPVRVGAYCKKFEIVTAKTIRINDVASLRPLADRYGDSLKVVHLVRDPRGQVASVSKALSFSTLSQFRALAQMICARTRSNMNGQAWLTDKNYLLVKYENLALKPVEGARKIYDFVGATMPGNVERWIMKNTVRSNDDRTRHHDSKSGGPFPDQTKLGREYFSTTKNATQSIKLWIHNLKWAHVNIIQKECADLIDNLSYPYVKDVREFYHLRSQSADEFYNTDTNRELSIEQFLSGQWQKPG